MLPISNLGLKLIADNADNPSNSLKITVVLIYFFSPILLGVLYNALFECSKWQGSPGKIGLRLRVVNMQGTRVSFLQAVGRNLGKFISAPLLYMGFLMVIWTKEQQGLHDIMAKTYVIRNDKIY